MFNIHVLDHFSKPRNFSIPPTFEGLLVGEYTSDNCGDFVEIWIELDGPTISNVWWYGRGCCLSQAAASMLAEFLVGKPLEKLEWEFGYSDMLALFQADVEPGRIECVMTSYHAAHNALENR